MQANDVLSLTHAPGAQYRLVGTEGARAEVHAGLSDTVRQIPVTGTTIFNGYSIAKTFTAVAVLQLVEQGKLALSDEVGALFPEYRFSGKFSVEQLLSHQAGIANPLPLAWIHLAGEDAAFDAAGFSKRIIAANTQLKSPPGSKTRYSNVGYLILGELIERVSGMEYPAYVRRHVFEKIATKGFLGFAGPDTDDYATGYHKGWSFTNLLLWFLLDKKRYTRPTTSTLIAFELA